MLPQHIHQRLLAFENDTPGTLYDSIQRRRGGKITRLAGADPLTDAYDRILMALCLILMHAGSKQALALLDGVAKESDLPPNLLLHVQWYQAVGTMLFAFPPDIDQTLQDEVSARKSIELFEEVVASAQKLNKRMFEGLALSMIAECHAWLGEPKKAKEMAETSARLLRGQGESPRRVGRARVNDILLRSDGGCPTFTTADYRYYLYQRGELR